MYKLIVRNVKKNRDKPEKMKLKKLPIDIPYLKAYLKQVLTVIFSSDGKHIKNIVVDDNKADKQ